MSSLNDDKDFPEVEGDDSDVDLQNCLKDPSLMSLMRADSNGANLDAVRQSMLRSLSASPSGFLEDRILLDSLPLASKLTIESFEELENILTRDSPNLVSMEDVRSKFSLWQSSLEPWHEFLKHLRNLGAVPCDTVQNLLNSLPDVIQAVFSHCKRSASLYGPKFDSLRPQLTSLYRQTDVVLDVFFSIIESTVNFDVEFKSENNSLRTVLDKIGDIAVLTCEMDLKTLWSTWKAFAKLAAVHESLLKKSGSTDCVTRRYADIARDIETLLLVSLQDKRDTNCERTIKCAGFLLKILGRLCTLYHGYCGNKVSTVLVQLLTKLYRYSPPFPSEHFTRVNSKIAECSETHVVPATVDLLNSLLGDSEFSKAFFRYGKSKLKEPMCYHVLTLRVIEKLTTGQQSSGSSWLQENDNIIDVALTNVNACCGDILVNELRLPVGSAVIFGNPRNLGIYETTLRLLCRFIAQTSVQDFAAVEIALLRHLLKGEFWSSLLSCDSWTYLGRIASPELCQEHLLVLIKLQKFLSTREKSLEFEIISNLIGRLYDLLPNDMRESIFREIEDYSNRRFVDPFRGSLPPRARQYLLCQQGLIDTTSNLAHIFQELRRSPSMKTWTRLIHLLSSIGAAAIPNDERLCTVTTRSIWSFLASSIPKAEGITREMLLELAIHLFHCTQPDSSDNSANDRLIASIYKSMLEMVEHVPIQHRIRINIFLRDKLEPYVNESGKQSISAITELFCCLVNDDNPWVRQESFETYAEYILKGSSVQLFDALSIGISQLPRVCRQMPLYLSSKQIYSLSSHESLENYLHQLAKSFENPSTLRHKCYEPDFRQRDEKLPRLEIERIDKRVDDICDEIRDIVKRRNELSDASIDKLRVVLLQLLEPSG